MSEIMANSGSHTVEAWQRPSRRQFQFTELWEEPRKRGITANEKKAALNQQRTEKLILHRKETLNLMLVRFLQLPSYLASGNSCCYRLHKINTPFVIYGTTFCSLLSTSPSLHYETNHANREIGS